MALDIFVELKATISDFESKMSTVRKQLADTNAQGSSHLENLATKGQSALGGLSQAFAGMSGVGLGAISAVGGAVAGFATASVAHYDTLAKSVKSFSNVTGETAQQSSVMIAQADAFHVPIDVLTKSMGLLGANVQLHAAYFQKWGVEIAKNADGSNNMAGTLANLARRYQDTADATVKDAMAKQLLSRGYQQLIPLLNATPEVLNEIAKAAKDRGEILSQKDVDSAMAFQRAVTELKANIQALGTSLAKDITPELLNMTRGLDQLTLDADKLTQTVGGLAGLFHGALSIATLGVSNLIEHLGEKHNKTADAAAIQEQAAQKLTDILNQQQTAVDGLNKTLDDYVSAQQGMAAADKGVADANQSVTDAQDALNTLLQKGAVDAKAVRTAQEGVVTADKGVADAHRQVADAQDSLNTLLRTGAVDAKAVASAQDTLTRATRTAGDAVQSLADAQANLADVERGATPLDKEQAQLRVSDATNQLAHAQNALATLQNSGTGSALDLSDAHNAVEQAQIDLTKSQQTLSDVMAQGLPGSKEYKAAQDQVASATRSVADAQKAQKDAADNLRIATAGDPDFSKKVSDARQKVADAEDNVTSSTWHQRDAHQALATATAGDPKFAREVADAKQNLADKEDAVTAAKWRQFTAAQNLAGAQAAENDALLAGGGVAATLGAQLDAIAASSPQTAGVVASLEQLLGLEQTTNAVVGPQNTLAYNNAVAMLANPAFIPFSGAFAAGGDFGAGDTILVGEHGPELARFGTGGTIINNATTGAIVQAANAVVGLGVTERVTAALSHALGGAAVGGPAVTAAESWYGVPYLWGGGHGVDASTARRFGVDCSGLVDQVMGIQGTTYTQVNMGSAVPNLKSAAGGDLIFFGPQAPGEPHHVGIYKGGGIMIDAPHTGTVVRDDQVSGFGPIYAIRRLAQAAAQVAGVGGHGSNQALMQAMAAARGWGGGEWSSLFNVEMREAGFNQFARNPSSGAYGIPQALPESKLPFAGQAAGGSDPRSQIGWMLDYIAGRYRDPAGAWGHEQAFGWYDQGGYLPPGLSLAYNGTGRPEPVGGAAGTVINVYVQGSMFATVADVTNAVRQVAQQQARAGIKWGA